MILIDILHRCIVPNWDTLHSRTRRSPRTAVLEIRTRIRTRTRSARSSTAHTCRCCGNAASVACSTRAYLVRTARLQIRIYNGICKAITTTMTMMLFLVWFYSYFSYPSRFGCDVRRVAPACMSWHVGTRSANNYRRVLGILPNRTAYLVERYQIEERK